jgi:hypothetical protein
MPTVFLSYRKSDTGSEVGRLADSLKQNLGRRLVFRDLADIPPGAAFDAVLERELDAARLVLVLIGPGWLEALEQRLVQPGIDYVRIEVATALSKGKRVIPILLRGAALPQAGALPEDLRPLAKRQAMTLRDEAWNSDVARLLDAIGRPYRWGLLAIRVVVALVAIVAAVWLLVPRVAYERSSDYGFLRGLALLLVGLYGAVELSIGYLHSRRLKQRRAD